VVPAILPEEDKVVPEGNDPLVMENIFVPLPPVTLICWL